MSDTNQNDNSLFIPQGTSTPDHPAEQAEETPKQAKKPAASTTAPSNQAAFIPQTTTTSEHAEKPATEGTEAPSEHPYRDIITHPWESVKHAADYYTRPDEKAAEAPKTVEKPRANPQGVAPLIPNAPENLPSAAKMPMIDMHTTGEEWAPPVDKQTTPNTFLGRLSHPSAEDTAALGGGPYLISPEKLQGMKDVNSTLSQHGAQFGKRVGANVIPVADLLAEDTGLGNGKPLTEEEARKQHPIATGVAEGVGGFVGGQVSDPVNWALALTGGAELPVLSKLTSLAFSAKMGKDTLEGIKQLRANWGTLNEEQRAEEITKLGLSGLFAEEAGRHFVKGTVTPGSDLANKFAGRDTAGESSIPTVRAGGQFIKQDMITPVFEKTVRGTGKAAEFALQHPKITGAVAAGAGLPGIGHIVGPLGGVAAGELISRIAPEAHIPTGWRGFGLSVEEKAAIGLEDELSNANKTLNKTQKQFDTYDKSGGEIPDDVRQAKERAQSKVDDLKVRIDDANSIGEFARKAKAHGVTIHPDFWKDMNKVVGEENGAFNIEFSSQFPKGYRIEKVTTQGSGVSFNVKGPGDIAPEHIGRPTQPEPQQTPGFGKIMTPEGKEQGVLIRPQPLLTAGEIPTEDITARPPAEVIPEVKPTAPEAKPIRGNVPDELRSTLKKSGYSDTQIDRMRPDEAQAHSEATEKQRTEVKATRADKRTTEQLRGLSDENLKKIAPTVGIDPAEYDFKARSTDGKRTRTEVQQLAQDITAQLHPEETMRHADNAERMDKEGLWENKDQSGKGKAARAAELFKHRLNGEVDAYGNPKASVGLLDMSPRELHENLGFGERNTHTTKEEFEANRKEFLDKASRSNGGVDPTMLVNAYRMAEYYFEGGLREFSEFSKQMISRLGETIKPHLKEIYARAEAHVSPTWTKSIEEWTAGRSKFGLDEQTHADWLKARDKARILKTPEARAAAEARLGPEPTPVPNADTPEGSQLPEAMGGPKLGEVSRSATHIGERLEPNDPRVAEKLDRYTSTDDKNQFYRSVKRAIRSTAPGIPTDAVTELAHETMADFRENVLNGKFKVPANTVDEKLVTGYLATGESSIAHNKATQWAELAEGSRTGKGKGSLETPDTLNKSEGQSGANYKKEAHDTSSEQDSVTSQLMGGNGDESKATNLPEEMKSPYGEQPAEHDARPHALHKALTDYLKENPETAEADRRLLQQASTMATEKAEAARVKAYDKEFTKSGDVDKAIEAGNGAASKKNTSTDSYFGLTDADYTKLGKAQSELSSSATENNITGTKLRARISVIMAYLRSRALSYYEGPRTGRPRIVRIEDAANTYKPIQNPANTWMSQGNPEGPPELIPTRPTQLDKNPELIKGMEVAEPHTNAKGQGVKSGYKTLKSRSPFNNAPSIGEIVNRTPAENGTFIGKGEGVGTGYGTIKAPDFSEESRPAPKESTQSTGRDVTPGTAQAQSDVQRAQEAYDNSEPRSAERKAAKAKLDAEMEFLKSVREEEPKATYGNEPQLIPVPKNAPYTSSTVEPLIHEEMGRGGRIGISTADKEGSANRGRVSNMSDVDNAVHDVEVAKRAVAEGVKGAEYDLRDAKARLAKAQHAQSNARMPSIGGGSQGADEKWGDLTMNHLEPKPERAVPKDAWNDLTAEPNSIAQSYLKELEEQGFKSPAVENLISNVPDAGRVIEGVQEEAKKFGTTLAKRGFEQPHVQLIGDYSSGTKAARPSSMGNIQLGSAQYSPNELIPESNLDTEARRALAPRIGEANRAARAPEEAKYDQLQKVRDRLGIKKHSYASDATEVPAQDIERARVRSSAKYDYTEKPKGDSMRHTVTATDAKGNHLATVEATSSADGTQWTIRGSVSDVDPKLRANIGEEAYSKLFRSAADKASKTGQSVTIHADPDLLTPSGVRVWERLEKEFPQIKWEGKGIGDEASRPSIEFTPKKPVASAPLPKAMGGGAEPENNTFMHRMLNRK